nr:MAG TPA: zinc-ribbon domain protein [Caudoviricetes sp.]
MAMLSVEDILEITSRNPKFCRIKRATFTCDFCTTSVDVCDERIATTLADSRKTPSCPICGKKTICSLYEFQSHENPNIIEDVRWR